MLRAVATGLADAEVRRLDVAVVDARLVEHDQGIEQVGAEPLEEVKGEPGAAAQRLSEGLGAGALEQERLAAADDEGALDELDDARRLQ